MIAADVQGDSDFSDTPHLLILLQFRYDHDHLAAIPATALTALTALAALAALAAPIAIITTTTTTTTPTAPST